MKCIYAAAKIGEKYFFAVIGLSADQIPELPKNMLGISSASPEELAKWYSAADCLANPTLEDNMPMVNLEALSCGTPIVAFDTGGCAEAIGDCGCVVPKRDTAAFCEAIRKYTDCSSEISQKCLERARRFNAADTFAQYINLYKELIQ